jgi:alpha-2-macroglobulin
VREDRVVLFGDVGTDVKQFVYAIKATNVGKYTVPPVQAEAMYDRSVVARSLAGKIEVVPR